MDRTSAASARLAAVAATLAELDVDAAIVEGLVTIGVTALDDLRFVELSDFLDMGLKPIQARRMLSVVRGADRGCDACCPGSPGSPGSPTQSHHEHGHEHEHDAAAHEDGTAGPAADTFHGPGHDAAHEPDTGSCSISSPHHSPLLTTRNPAPPLASHHHSPPFTGGDGGTGPGLLPLAAEPSAHPHPLVLGHAFHTAEPFHAAEPFHTAEPFHAAESFTASPAADLVGSGHAGGPGGPGNLGAPDHCASGSASGSGPGGRLPPLSNSGAGPFSPRKVTLSVAGNAVGTLLGAAGGDGKFTGDDGGAHDYARQESQATLADFGASSHPDTHLPKHDVSHSRLQPLSPLGMTSVNPPSVASVSTDGRGGGGGGGGGGGVSLGASGPGIGFAGASDDTTGASALIASSSASASAMPSSSTAAAAASAPSDICADVASAALNSTRTDSTSAPVVLDVDSTSRSTHSASTPPAFRWQRGGVIGTGAFGTVYAALNSVTGSMMAVVSVTVISSRLPPRPCQLDHPRCFVSS